MVIFFNFLTLKVKIVLYKSLFFVFQKSKNVKTGFFSMISLLTLCVILKSSKKCCNIYRLTYSTLKIEYKKIKFKRKAYSESYMKGI